MNIEKYPKIKYILDKIKGNQEQTKNIIGEEVAVAADEITVEDPSVAGTTLTADVTAVAHNEFIWSINKSVSPTELNLCNGTTGTATYTISVIKSASSNAFITGIVTVTNGGAVATENLAITIDLTKPPSQTVIASTTVDVSSNPVLDPGTPGNPGETGTYGYSIPIPSGFAVGDTYKVTANVTITNHSGPHYGEPFGPSPSATAMVPPVTNDTIHVTDTNGKQFTFSSTGSQSYSIDYNCPDDAGTHNNTATIDETGQLSSASVTVNCQTCRGLIIKEII